MRNKFGRLCIVLGTALVAAALSLFIHNQRETAAAEQASMELLVQMANWIQDRTEATMPTFASDVMINPEGLGSFEMTEVEIDGHDYIGYLSVPNLELELPVMADWDYSKLKIAPCRYTGSVRGGDLVLMAHNYAGHFGGLSKLSEGDLVIFTDMDGITTNYEVVGLDVLAPTAVDKITSGNFDLTLFTCTYGGRSRVSVYCDRLKTGEEEKTTR